MFHKHIYLASTIAAACFFRSPVSESGGAANPATNAQPGAGEGDGEQSGATGTGTGTDSSPVTKPDANAKKGAKPEVKADPQLGNLINTYEDSAEKTQSFFVEMLDYIQKSNISRPVLVKTLMEFRKITADSAVTQASRIFTMLKKPDVVDALRAGEITLKVARAQTTKSREKSTASGSAGTNESKERDYENKLKAFAAAAKALGYDLKSILAGVKATLQADPYNIK